MSERISSMFTRGTSGRKAEDAKFSDAPPVAKGRKAGAAGGSKRAKPRLTFGTVKRRSETNGSVAAK